MLESKVAIKAFSKLDQFLDGSLDKELKSSLMVPALISGVVGLLIYIAEVNTTLDLIFLLILAALPLWWSYIKIAKISTVPFKDNLWKNIGIGVASNIVVSIVSGILSSIIDIESLGALFWFIYGNRYIFAAKIDKIFHYFNLK